MADCDATSSLPDPRNSDDGKGDGSKEDEAPRNGLCATHHRSAHYMDAPSQFLMMSLVDPVQESPPKSESLVLVDDLIQKLQPHPRAEIHRHQVFEYVKKIIERAVLETSETSDPAPQQQPEAEELPSPAEVHVCRFG